MDNKYLLDAKKKALENAFKEKAKFEAIRIASGLKVKTNENDYAPMDGDQLLIDARKIYDWLIDGIIEKTV